MMNEDEEVLANKFFSPRVTGYGVCLFFFSILSFASLMVLCIYIVASSFVILWDSCMLIVCVSAFMCLFFGFFVYFVLFCFYFILLFFICTLVF